MNTIWAVRFNDGSGMGAGLTTSLHRTKEGADKRASERTQRLKVYKGRGQYEVEEMEIVD